MHDALVHDLTALIDAPIELEPMVGSTSSDLFLVHARSVRYVLRVFRSERWETPVGRLCSRETRILRALQSTGMPVPRPIGTLPTNGVLMSWLPGRILLPARPGVQWLRELARALREIHSTTITVPYAYESWNDVRGQESPGWWQDTGLWEAAQSAVDEPPEFEAVLVHRDYHPTNVLWIEDRISGIVDWINACMGPAGIDVAHCRLNLALMYGPAAADAFLDAYEAETPDYRHDPYWDLDDALGVLPDVEPYAPWATFGLTGLTTETVRTRIEAYVGKAVSTLRAR
ncbi:MAG: aminoglycoside phosphotransferase family protein [Gammaproteobacteria bacterium]